MALLIFDKNLIHETWLPVNFAYLQDSNLLSKSKDNYHGRIILKSMLQITKIHFLNLENNCCVAKNNLQPKG